MAIKELKFPASTDSRPSSHHPTDAEIELSAGGVVKEVLSYTRGADDAWTVKVEVEEPAPKPKSKPKKKSEEKSDEE